MIRNLHKDRRQTGMSLIELLVVAAIITILMALITPALNSILRGSRLSQAGQLLGEQLGLARQEATAKNRTVEFRIYQIDGAYRACQVFLLDERNENPAPSTRLKKLPEGIAIVGDTTFSPLLSDTHSISGTDDAGGAGAASYRAIRFRATGALDRFSTNFPYLTLAAKTDADPASDNVYVIQLDPLSGHQTTYRP